MLSFERGWVRAERAHLTGFFGTLRNSGSTDIRITHGASPGAGTVDFHDVEADPDGRRRMVHLPDGILVPAGGAVELVPGGLHGMLMDLEQRLEVGQIVEITIGDGPDALITHLPALHVAPQE